MKSNKKDTVPGTFLAEKERPVSALEQNPAQKPAALLQADRAFLEEVPQQAAAILQHDGRIMQANASFYKTFKLQGDVKSQNLLNFLSPTDRRLLERKLLLAHHNGNVCSVSLQNEETGRQVKWAIQSANGILYLKETLSRPETSPAGRQGPPAASSFLEIIPWPALLYSRKHELLMVNQKFAALSGKNPSQLVAGNKHEGFSAEQLSQLKELRAGLAEGSLQEVKCRLQLSRKGEESRWYDYSEKVLPEGCMPTIAKAYSIAVLYDIEELTQQEELLRNRQEEVDLFMDRASHDLKGPLKSMMSLYQLVECEFGRDARVMEYVQHYHNGISRLYRILEDMLQLSRLSKAEHHYSRVNLQHMVEESLQSFRNLPQFFEISFIKEIEVPSELLLEESLLQTIVQNLLENAIKYCALENPEVKILLKQEDSGIRLQVADNGIGIPVKLQSRVFDRYFRATSQASGSGLGLYLLKQAVDKLRGEVSLQSSEGKGTTFSVYIPCSGLPLPAKL